MNKSKKIRIYPTSDQKKILKKWLGTARFVFNKSVEYLRKPSTIAAWKSIKGDLLDALPNWAIETPYQVKSIAIRDCCKAVSTAKRRTKATGRFQRVRYRSRKDKSQSMFIPKSSITKRGIYPRLLGELKWSEHLPENICDSRLIFDHGRWFVTVSYIKDTTKSENQGRVVALDPGVRTFMTWFSSNDCGKLGNGDFGRITRLCVFLDRLYSKRSKSHGQQKRRIQKAIDRMYWKIQNLVDELHHQSAKFLTDNFDIILLPTFETQSMVRKGNRNIKKDTVRSMLTWAHFRFKQFLRHKCQEKNKLLIDTNEAWTSRTISWTGEILSKSSIKWVYSKKTKMTMDRDYNGARGIYLRALRDTSPIEIIGHLCS